jgi:hypothetical protein
LRGDPVEQAPHAGDEFPLRIVVIADESAGIERRSDGWEPVAVDEPTEQIGISRRVEFLTADTASPGTAAP